MITAELLRVVKVLDGITRYRFGMNPEKMAEWKAVRQVLGVSPRGRAAPGVEPGPTLEPGSTSTPGDVAPAA